MVDIFSSFDPFINLTYVYISPRFWIFILARIFLIRRRYWLSFRSLIWALSTPLDVISTQSLRTSSFHIKGLTRIIVGLFIMFIIINFLGLLPYSFSYRRHIVFRLAFGLPLWLSLILSRIVYSPKIFIGGLLPSGAPDWLNPFLVIVESIRIIVRPITLSVRLVANIRAGHIVLRLVGIYRSSYIFSSTVGVIRLLFIQTFYIIFEIGICLIQAYIFCLLITLYADDHPSK